MRLTFLLNYGGAHLHGIPWQHVLVLSLKESLVNKINHMVLPDVGPPSTQTLMKTLDLKTCR